MRAIGIDVHRDFCEVAISEGGELRITVGDIAATVVVGRRKRHLALGDHHFRKSQRGTWEERP